MAKVTVKDHTLIPTVLGSLGMLAAFSFTFAAQRTFDILVTAEVKWKKLILVWGYAAIIFAVVIIVLWQYGDHPEDEVIIEAKKGDQ
jgi:hypothetical protein